MKHFALAGIIILQVSGCKTSASNSERSSTASNSGSRGNYEWADVTLALDGTPSNCVTTPENCAKQDLKTYPDNTGIRPLLTWSRIRKVGKDHVFVNGGQDRGNRADAECANFFNGRKGWRIPKVKELKNLATRGRSVAEEKWIPSDAFWNGRSMLLDFLAEGDWVVSLFSGAERSKLHADLFGSLVCVLEK